MGRGVYGRALHYGNSRRKTWLQEKKTAPSENAPHWLAGTYIEATLSTSQDRTLCWRTYPSLGILYETATLAA